MPVKSRRYVPYLRLLKESNYEPAALIIDGLKWAEAPRENTPFPDFLGDVRMSRLGPGLSVLQACLRAKGSLGACLVVVCFSVGLCYVLIAKVTRSRPLGRLSRAGPCD